MAKRRVSQVMAEGYGFGQIFVEIESSVMVLAICETSMVCVSLVLK